MGRSRADRTKAVEDQHGALRRGRQRAWLISAGPNPRDGLAELRELLKTAGASVLGETVQVLSEPHPDSYLGSGRIDELSKELAGSEVNLIVCDDELTPRQERTLEKRLEKPVIDRTAVILDIFALHAGSAEGKLQVELAQLQYNLARMRGLWTHLERLGGGIGTRGPGESQIETDRRLARDRIAKVRKRLKSVEASRGRMRAERTRTAIPSISLVGYTNAGKSTLMRALTGAEVGVRDELFHTLDPTTRVFAHRGREYVLTDTVGFIRKLPHQLIDAFGATLEETVLSDLLLVVSDGSADPAEQELQRASVEETLHSINADSTMRLDVINKVDLLDDAERELLARTHPDSLLVSAQTGEGLEALADSIAAAIRSGLLSVELLVPYSEGRAIEQLHNIAGDLEREELADGVLIRARLSQAQAARFSKFTKEADGNR